MCVQYVDREEKGREDGWMDGNGLLFSPLPRTFCAAAWQQLQLSDKSKEWQVITYGSLRIESHRVCARVDKTNDNSSPSTEEREKKKGHNRSWTTTTTTRMNLMQLLRGERKEGTFVVVLFRYHGTKS